MDSYCCFQLDGQTIVDTFSVPFYQSHFLVFLGASILIASVIHINFALF